MHRSLSHSESILYIDDESAKCCSTIDWFFLLAAVVFRSSFFDILKSNIKQIIFDSILEDKDFVGIKLPKSYLVGSSYLFITRIDLFTPNIDLFWAYFIHNPL